MSVSIDSHKRRIMECPVCLEWLRPPITTCENGHATCGTCRQSSIACSICRGSFTCMKSTLLDELATTLLIRCSNSIVGCKESYPETEIRKHEKESCLYRTVDCYLCIQREVFIRNLNEHFVDRHSAKNRYTVNFACFVPVILSSVSMWRKQKDYLTLYTLIFVRDVKTHFLVRYYGGEDKHILYVGVQFLGKNQDEAKNDVFDVRINQSLGPNKSFFTCTSLCVPYKTHFNFTELEKKEKMMRINLETLFFNNNYHLSEKGFTFEVQIRKL